MVMLASFCFSEGRNLARSPIKIGEENIWANRGSPYPVSRAED